MTDGEHLAKVLIVLTNHCLERPKKAQTNLKEVSLETLAQVVTTSK
jgi:hypothetical protein